MASTKGIRTYRNNNKRPCSKLALDFLLANNLRKRLEISINSPGPSKEKSSESTFDRVLKGEVYNKVTFKTFPDNNLNSNESSIFSRSNDSLDEFKQKELRGSISESSPLKLSPVVILERNVENSPCMQKNKKTEAPKQSGEDPYLVASNYSNNISQSGPAGSGTQEDHNASGKLQEIDIVISQLHDCQKMLLMESLQLNKTSNEEYLNFENSVDRVSTPQTRSHNYRLRKNPRKNPKLNHQDLCNSNFSAVERKNSSIHRYHRLQSQIDKLSLSRNEIIQGKHSELSNSDLSAFSDTSGMQKTDENEKFEIEDFLESPQTTSTPLHVKSLKCQDHPSRSLLSKSLEIINEWSNRCPTPTIFNNSFQNSTLKQIKCRESSKRNRNLLKTKRDTKLFKKARVILKNIPHLENMIKDSFANSTSVDPKILITKRNNYVTRRKKSNPIKNVPPLKNCAVYLTPLEMSKMEASIENPEVKELSSQKSKSWSQIPKTPLELDQQTKRKSEMKYCYSIEDFLEKSPKVVLQKLDFSKYISPKKSSFSGINDSTDSLSIIHSGNEFRGFNVNSDTRYSHLDKDSATQMNKNLLRESHDLQYEFEENSPLTKDKCSGKIIKTNLDQFKKKDCFVILDRMIIDPGHQNNNKQLTLNENELNKMSSDCWVILSDKKEGEESTSSRSVINVQEHMSELGFIKPKSTQSLFDQISLPNSQSLIEECVVLKEPPVTMRTFVSLAPGKKFRRSVAVFKKNLELDDSGKSPSTSRITLSRRQSVKFIPVHLKNEVSDLARIALNNSGYVSLRQSFRRSSLEEVENYLPNVQPVENYLNYITKNTADPFTARDIVLKRCGQTEPINFEKCYPTSVLQHCQKIGEGVFGEVFMIRDKDGSTTVMKVIPIEGEQIVNLEKQKTFEEIVSEIIISMELSNLDETKRNNTDAFVKVKGIRCVQGCYPERLLELWDLYDENKQSENDSPEIFLEDQLYIVIELANAGQDLEAFQFKNAQQALAVFEQITCALAVAESELQFEHRDLHWGNVLITQTEQKNTVFVLDGKEIMVNNRGTKATIIDFTLSRVESEGVIIFNDLSMDEDLFTAKGDYQFDIYRKMQENNGNQWQSFKPFSNILWLHYILDKAMKGFRYKNTKSKLHKAALTTLRAYEQKILESNSATDFVLNNFISNILIE